MKVLWFLNAVLPFFEDISEYGRFYGCPWADALIQKYIQDAGFELAVMCPESVRRYTQKEKEGIRYYAFPEKGEKQAKNAFRKIIQKEQPDIIHIWGTEQKNSYFMFETCRNMGLEDRTCIHIQGLIFFCSWHIRASLPVPVIYKGTVKDWVRHTRVIDAERSFRKNGKYELAILKNAKHILGRTEWDYACTKLINKNAKYHFSRELMRKPFYKYTWHYAECEKHSIFIRGGGWFLKGMHYVLEAMRIIRKKYPDTRLYVASGGMESKFTGSIASQMKKSYYDKYILRLLKRYKLRNHVILLDSMDDEEMLSHYKRANVFVSASTIENSCNCLLEARLTGTPAVASFAGGAAYAVEHGKTGYLYQHDDFYMLAYYVCKIFKAGEKAERLSCSERRWAHKFADRNSVYEELMSVYKEIINE